MVYKTWHGVCVVFCLVLNYIFKTLPIIIALQWICWPWGPQFLESSFLTHLRVELAKGGTCGIFEDRSENNPPCSSKAPLWSVIMANDVDSLRKLTLTLFSSSSQPHLKSCKPIVAPQGHCQCLIGISHDTCGKQLLLKLGLQVPCSDSYLSTSTRMSGKLVSWYVIHSLFLSVVSPPSFSHSC